MVESGQRRASRLRDRGARVLVDVPFDRRDHPTALVECLTVRALSRRVPDAYRGALEILQFHLWLHVTAGRGSHLVDFECHELAPGTVLHVAPGQVHRWDWSAPIEGHVLVVGLGAFSEPRLRGSAARGDAVVDIDGWPPSLALARGDRARVSGWFRELVRASSEHDGSAASHALMRHLALVALIDIRRSQRRAASAATADHTTADLDRLRQLRALIERSFRVTRSVGDYAAALACSVRTLDRVCIATTARSAKALIDQRTVLEARRRLAHSDVTLEALADELGFSEATNFAKFFRRHTGQTAGEFRRPFRGR